MVWWSILHPQVLTWEQSSGFPDLKWTGCHILSSCHIRWWQHWWRPSSSDYPQHSSWPGVDGKDAFYAHRAGVGIILFLIASCCWVGMGSTRTAWAPSTISRRGDTCLVSCHWYWHRVQGQPENGNFKLGSRFVETFHLFQINSVTIFHELMFLVQCVQIPVLAKCTLCMRTATSPAYYEVLLCLL